MTDAADGAVGFTGVEWELRTAEELARTLAAGPGPGQSGELSATWSAAAAELEAVASEYRRLAVELSADWISEASPHLDDRSREVADDIFALAGRAREFSDRAADHAHAHTIARASMPRAEEIAVTGRALDALDSLGPGLAGVLTGATGALENVRSDQRRAAARVMTEYEARTEPLASPRERPAETRHLLPGLFGRPADSAPSADTSAPGPASAPVPGSPLPATASALTPLSGSGVVQAPGTPVRPATVGNPTPAAPTSGAGTGLNPPTAGAASERAGAGIPMAPPIAGAGAGTSAGADREHHADEALRPSPGPTEIEELYGLSVAVAPSVFGGATPAAGTVPAGGEPA